MLGFGYGIVIDTRIDLNNNRYNGSCLAIETYNIDITSPLYATPPTYYKRF
jgi:hypothetical protein